MRWHTGFYQLPKDLRWLENPHTIGGHDPDILQMGYSLGQVIKDHFPINGVPGPLVAQYEAFMDTLREAQERLERVCELMNQAQAIGSADDRHPG